MFNSAVVNKVEEHVRELFKTKLNGEILYHNINHTTEVVDAVQEIGSAEKINSDDLEILVIAGWFHDTGHFHCCNGHEEQSAVYAKEFLDEINYPDKRIDTIVNCIKATKVPQNPKTKLEEIICDADLCHLGSEDIRERGDLLRKEFELRGIKKLSDVEWLNYSLDFFNQHRFFTEFAEKKYGTVKKSNMQMMLDKLNELKRN